MPVKKLRVSFDIDMEVLVKALAIGHSNMDIQAYGVEDRVTHTQPVAVPQITDRGGMKKCILDALKPVKKMLMRDIRVVVVNAGYSAKSINGVIWHLQNDGLIRRAGYGVFSITAKGRNHDA